MATMMRGLISQGGEASINQYTFSLPEPEILTSDFFYENIQIPETGQLIINSPFRPDFEKINSRFPDAKIVVVTHKLHELSKISRIFFKSYYEEGYETMSSSQFRKILLDHPSLFSNTQATPSQLSTTEREVFIKIVAYHKLLDGFYLAEIPSDPNVFEIQYGEMFYDKETTKSKLELITGKTFTQDFSKVYDDIAELQLRFYFQE